MSGLIGRSAHSCSNLMLVGGPQAVRELATHRLNAVHDVYVRGDVWETHANVVDVARCATRWVYPVTAKVSAALLGGSQDICVTAPLDTLSRELLEPSVGETIVVLVQGRDPGNVGMIVRAADASDAVGVVAVAGTVDAMSPKVVRSNASSAFRIPMCVAPSFADARALIHGRSAVLLGASGGTASVSLSDPLMQGVLVCSRLSQSYAWVFSNKVRSLSGDEIRLRDGLMSVPMTDDAESLNVASTAAICLFVSQTVRGAEN